jgi:hypothetical protein
LKLAKDNDPELEALLFSFLGHVYYVGLKKREEAKLKLESCIKIFEKMTKKSAAV